FGGADVVLAARRGGFELVVVLLGDDVLFDQLLATFVVGRGEFSLRAGALELSGEPVDLGLKWPRIDAEQQLALLDARAFRELRGFNEAGDARLDRYGRDRFESPGELLEITQRTRHDLGDADRRRRRRGRRRASLGPGAASEHARGQCTDKKAGGCESGK